MMEKVETEISAKAVRRRGRAEPLKLPKNINKKKLLRELIVALVVLVAIAASVFIPWLLAQPVPRGDQYAEYKRLYNDVAAYDFANGPSESLEYRIERAMNSSTVTALQHYFHLKAKIEYEAGLKDYEAALQTLEAAQEYAPDAEETASLYEKYIEVYKAQGDEISAEYFQVLLDELLEQR